MNSKELTAGLDLRERKVMEMAEKGDKEGVEAEVKAMMADLGRTFLSERKWEGYLATTERMVKLAMKVAPGLLKPGPKPGMPQP